MINYLVMGLPGVGKTRMARKYAEDNNIPLVYALLHSWSDTDELFYGVNVVAAVSGDSKNVKQDGVLAKAAKMSLEGKVVLCLDEIDKTTEATENLLLDFLQYGQVPTAPGQVIVANPDNIVVFITSNNIRPLSDALLRRCKRIFMRPLPVDEQVTAIVEHTNAPKGLVTVAWKAARSLAAIDGNEYLSLNEGFGLIADLLLLSNVTKVAVKDILVSWSIRKMETYLTLEVGTDLVSPIIAEMKNINKL